MKPHDRIRIRHMIEAATTIAGFVKGRERQELDSDVLLAFALIRAIEIFGEAASRITPETRSAITDLPWLAIVGMRNRLVHVYFDVDHDILWKAATDEIPSLVPILRSLVAED